MVFEKLSKASLVEGKVFTREGTTVVSTPVTQTRPEEAPPWSFHHPHNHTSTPAPPIRNPSRPHPTAEMAQPVVQTIHRDPALLYVRTRISNGLTLTIG